MYFRRIRRLDLAEFKAHGVQHYAFKCGCDIDILDLGYWWVPLDIDDIDGAPESTWKYEPPDKTWRNLIKEFDNDNKTKS